MKTTVNEFYKQAIDCYTTSSWLSRKSMTCTDPLACKAYLTSAEDLIKKGMSIRRMLHNGVFFSLN